MNTCVTICACLCVLTGGLVQYKQMESRRLTVVSAVGLTDEAQSSQQDSLSSPSVLLIFLSVIEH